MKTTIIALSAAALIAAAPAVFAQGASNKTPGHEMQHKVSKKHHAGVSGYAPGRQMQVSPKRGYPGAFGYAPAAPTDYYSTGSSQAGGGGGGGGGY